MQNIKFINSNFNASDSHFMEIANQLAKAYGYTANLAIDTEMAELIRLRIATFNNCSYCSILHYDVARKLGIEQVKIDNLNSYWDSQLFSEKEKSTLRYVDALNDRASQNFNDYHFALKQYYSETNIA